MSDKIIVHNRTDLPMVDILTYVQAVIDKGRVSGNDKAYCYASVFKNGIVVATTRNQASDTFFVWIDKGAAQGGEE